MRLSRRCSACWRARKGDYVIMPRSTVHRWIPTGDEPLRAYCVEANSHITPPKRYLSRYGQLLEHSPYCERDLHAPGEPMLVEQADVEVYTKHRGHGPSGLVGSIVVYPRIPSTSIGWDGCLYPYTFNVSDFEPITGRVHQPPPVHQVFEGYNFVICNFVPRKVDYHPLAVPVPYYHSNVDCDEVMFYSRATTRRARVRVSPSGSITLHPGGQATAPNRPPSRPHWARSTSTNSPSWSTLSARWRSARRGWRVTTACTRGHGAAAARRAERAARAGGRRARVRPADGADAAPGWPW